MKRLLAGFLLLGCSCVLAAEDEKPAPVRSNQLTPKEIAEGWILLFDGESTFGWRSPNDSKWTIANGLLAPQAGKEGQLVTTTAFLEYELSVDFLSRPSSRAWISFGRNWISFGEQEKGGGTKADGSNQVALLGKPNGAWATLGVHVLNGHVLSSSFVQKAGLGAFSNIDKPPVLPGAGNREDYKLFPITLSGNEVVLKNIKLKPLDTKALFNGKDLDGWKEHPGKKSKFTVADGLLSIKDGPGDLQTTGSYGDFLLQLECRTNGKNLNSGVFFRCRPGEYQQGYEAQIHNGFLDEPSKDYLVEKYDPQTHELKEKEKVKSAAMDYGTGAIYRRIPARKQAAKDQEWFTMTVVAQGKHIATWVNGVQTVDWTDNRPLKDNARNGCRLEAGPISLQGHDPTTDLSFRNIRLADLGVRQADKPREEKKD
jgi:hypothetical protein